MRIKMTYKIIAATALAVSLASGCSAEKNTDVSDKVVKVEQISADFRQNRAFGDTSMKIGMDLLHGILWKKNARDT